MSSSFQVATYAVRLHTNPTWGFGGSITLASAVLAHGIQVRATLNYESGLPAWAASSTSVGYVLDHGGFQPRLQLVVPAAQMDDAVDLLRHENPVNLEYDVRDLPSNPTSSTKLVNWATLHSGSEPVGEGPGDTPPIVFEAGDIFELHELVATGP
jgi:hypothetical protein